MGSMDEVRVRDVPKHISIVRIGDQRRPRDTARQENGANNRETVGGGRQRGVAAASRARSAKTRAKRSRPTPRRRRAPTRLLAQAQRPASSREYTKCPPRKAFADRTRRLSISISLSLSLSLSRKTAQGRRLGRRGGTRRRRRREDARRRRRHSAASAGVQRRVRVSSLTRISVSFPSSPRFGNDRECAGKPRGPRTRRV